MKRDRTTGVALGTALAAIAMMLGSCGVFEPRDAEPPSQSGFQYLPRTFPSNTILNLQKAIEQKDPVGYIASFSDSTRTQQGYVFVPSADAADVYGLVLRDWTYRQEESYFRNLVAKARQPVGFSSLTLTAKDSVVSGDSRTYEFDYSLVFEHTEPGFTERARGTLQFTLSVSNSEWTITRWVDLKSTPDLTWSSFKGKFSN